MNSLDQSLFLAINHGLKSGVNDLWLGYATWLGNGWIAFPVAILLLAALDPKRFGINFLLLASSAIAGGVSLNLLKNIFHSPRPLTVFADAIASGQVYVNVMFDRLYWGSFPSGHTQTAFTIGAVYLWALRQSSRLSRGNAVIVVMIASIVGLSRVYAGAHFPFDVVGGALLGAGTAWISCWSVERLLARRKVFRAAPSEESVQEAT